MKTKILKYSSLIVALVFLCLVWVLSFGSVPVYAATDDTTVLRELQIDPDFDPAAYPDNPEDYSLQVIQLAEDKDKELYIYVYQPAHNSIDLLGTKVSISYGYSVNGAGLEPKVYDLELASTSSVFDKYHVKGFTPSTDGDRYYNIVSIYREYNSVIDESDETFPTTDIAYSVGQQWYVCDLNDSRHYEMNTFNTMQVDTVFNGSVLFKNGFQLGSIFGNRDMCDVWIYSFDAPDYQIKHIYDADLNYSVKDVDEVKERGAFWEEWQTTSIRDYNEKLNQTLKIKDTSVMSYKGSGLFGKVLEWSTILPSEEFIATAVDQGGELSESDKLKIKSGQYVFSFLVTSRSEFTPPSLQDTYMKTSYSDVYDVGLLRLHFQDFSGKYYDLGVVNNLTDPDNNPDIIIDPVLDAFEEFWQNFIMVIGLILGLILLLILLQFIPPVKALLNFLIKCIASAISFPFLLIKWLFKKDSR